MADTLTHVLAPKRKSNGSRDSSRETKRTLDAAAV